MSDVNKIKIACGLFGIHIGRVNKAETLWLDKRDCTDEALASVRDYLKMQAERQKKDTFGYEWKTEDGETVELTIKIKRSGEE